jgi:ankyrin repeat protein
MVRFVCSLFWLAFVWVVVASNSASPSRKSEALAQAVLQNDAPIAQRLIEEGADVNALVFGATALHLAAEYGHAQIAQLLLDRGAIVDAVDNLGRTPLLWAAENHHTEVTQLLLSHGADVNREDGGEWRAPSDETPPKTALNYAVVQGDVELSRTLIGAGAKIRANDVALLQSAIRSGKIDLISLLIEKGINPAVGGKQGNNAFATAGSTGNVVALKILLAKSGNATSIKALLNDALQHAAENGRLAMVRFLLENTKVSLDREVESNYGGVERLADTKKKVPGFTAVSRAVENEHKEIVEALLEKGARVAGRTRSGAPVLSFAISLDRDELFQLLMKYRPPLDEADYEGRTALMTAAVKGKLEVVKTLLQHGAKIDKRDSMGAPALLRASEAGSKEVIEYLVSSGANINDRDKEGRDALTYAAMGGHDGICTLLITKGAAVNTVQSKTGMTALHGAAKEARPAAVKELLAHGASRDIADKKNKKPIDYARLAGDPETISLLGEKSASSEN